MLLLGSKTFTIDGVTVFSDHADPNQFWYLPAPVALEKREDGDPQFTLIKYRPAEVAAGVQGGGYLMFTAAVPLNKSAEGRIKAQISSVFPDITNPMLTPVPFDDGTVQCVSLNLQGPGGTAAPAPVPGAFNAVQTIHGATTPSLMGNNDAVFSLTLSQEGTTILESAFDDELEPIGVIYQLKYTGVRPALDVKVTADLKRAYQAFSVGLSVEAYYCTVGIDATWEKLVQDGAIKVEITNLAPNDADNKESEKWALQMFKDNLISTWFTPSLSPTTQQAVDLQAAADADAKANAAADKAAMDKLADNAKTTADKAAADAKDATAKSTSAQNDADAAMTAANAAKVAYDTENAKGDKADKPTLSKLGDAMKVAADKAETAKKRATDAKAVADQAVADARAAASAAGRALAPDVASKVSDKLAPKGSNPANSSLGAAPFGAALRLKYVNQDEQKTVTVEYTRQDAVQRTYAPQGYFGAFLKSVDKTKHVLDVDLDDPFFRQLDVIGTPPRDFGAIGLRSVHVAIDYGDPTDPEQHKHEEMEFDDKNTAPQKKSFYKNPSDSRLYNYSTDYHFDPQSGWDGEKDSYSFPATQTESSDLSLNPYEFLTFAQIRIEPGRINWDLVDYIEVDLDYTSASGWNPTKHFEIRNDTKATSWNLRLEGRSALSFGRRLTHHFKDGTTLSVPRAQMTAPAIVVEDPFFYFSVVVEPLLDATRTKQAFLDIKYQSADGSYEYETSFTFAAQSGSQIQKVRFPVLDLKQRSWSYRVTIVGVDNHLQRGAWIDTTDQEVFVTDLGGA